MNGQNLIEGMGFVDEAYVAEAAENIVAKGISKRKHVQTIWKYSGLAAACLVLFVAACITLPMLLPSSEDLSGITDDYSGTTPATKTPPLEQFANEEDFFAGNEPDIEINMDEIYVNELFPAMDSGRKYPNPEECVNAVWEEKDIIAYYGNNLVPPYIPEGLRESPANTTQAVVLSTEGEVWEDTVWLNFFHDYYEDGSPKLTDDISATKGFYLNASRIGLLTGFCHASLMKDAKASDIGGTAVYISYQSMKSGPYDPDTHEPYGYYDLYVAQFTLNGTEYELVFSQMELEEVVKVAASIIYGESSIIILRNLHRDNLQLNLL